MTTTHEKPTPAPVEVTLKPCPDPFGVCNGDEVLMHRVPGQWAVSCDCGQQVRADTEAEAITAWNTRHSAPAGDGNLYLIDGSGQKRPLSITDCRIDTTQDTVVVSPAGEVEPVACKYPVHGCVTHHRNGVERCDFCGSPADQEPITRPAPPVDMVELVEALRNCLAAGLPEEVASAARTVLAKHTRAQGEG